MRKKRHIDASRRRRPGPGQTKQTAELSLEMCRMVLGAKGFTAQAQAVCESVRKHFGFSRVALFLTDDTCSRLEGVAVVGLPHAYIKSQIYRIEDRPGIEVYRAVPRAAATGQVQVCRNRMQDPVYRAAQRAQNPMKTYAKEYACLPLQVNGTQLGVLSVSVLPGEKQLTQKDVRQLTRYADLMSLAIMQAKASHEARTGYVEILTTLAGVIESRDVYTNAHTWNVVSYATSLASAMNLPEEEVEAIQVGAILHDIGKVAVPDAILRKADKLTAEEIEEMKKHTVIGSEILDGYRFLRTAVSVARHHHENWDGTGYPDRLRGEEIPRAARIVGIADVYDALTTDRPYRARLSQAEAVAFMRQETGRKFDPSMVPLFLETLGLRGNGSADMTQDVEARVDDAGVVWIEANGTVSLDMGRHIAAACFRLSSRERPDVVVNLLRSHQIVEAGLWALARAAVRCRTLGGVLVLVATGSLRERVVHFADSPLFVVTEDMEAVARFLRRYRSPVLKQRREIQPPGEALGAQ